MSEKAGAVVKVAAGSAGPYIFGLGALAVGAYLASKKGAELTDFLGGIGAGFGGAMEGAGAEVTKYISETTRTVITEVGSIGDLDPDRALSEKEEAAIKGREAQGQPWSLKPKSTKQIREAPKSAGAWTENLIDAILTGDPAKKGPTRGVPTGVLSEYTFKEAEKTVYEDEQYKGPSLFGWLTRPASEIVGKKPQTSPFYPGMGRGTDLIISSSPKEKRPSQTIPGAVSGYPLMAKSGPRGGGATIKTKKKEEKTARKAGGDIHGRRPGYK